MELAPYYSLQGQTAIVTGGATGIGLGVTECLVAAGAKVVVIGTSAKNAQVLQKFGNNAVYYTFNITETEKTPDVVGEIQKREGPIDILVNNAGNHCKKPIEEMTVDDFCSVLNVHLVGAFALTKAVIPAMKARQKGSVLFMASMTSFIGQTNVTGYSAAKAGYLGMVHTLASECGAEGVRVNAIAPGWIDTPMFRKATDGDAPRMEKILGRIPMKRLGNPMDIGMAALFLCSDAARYINGVCLPVDGGGLIGF
ncbi:SDR family oxidoreductase [Ruminococcaceae bacterium OttesenSCG-928-A16]|nr:SDR family oxidoreductase [Ruminococcaceae bacterium OttesenSCG-928-A16]